MPKQDFRYCYDTINIYQKPSDYYASSNINIWKNQKYHQSVLFYVECKSKWKSRDGRGFPRAGRAAPWEIPRSSPASPWKTPSIPSLLLGLTQYQKILLSRAKFAKKNFFYSGILHLLLIQVFKYETPFLHYISPRILNLNFFWTSDFRSEGKKTFKRYLKSEQTHRHTYGQIDLKRALAQSAMLWKYLIS